MRGFKTSLEMTVPQWLTDFKRAFVWVFLPKKTRGTRKGELAFVWLLETEGPLHGLGPRKPGFA